MQPPDQLVAYARKIAVYRAYDNLENGLQPLDVLNTKFEHEQKEFADAVANKDIWRQYHEAADLLYYAVCIDIQTRNYYGEPNMNLFSYYNVFAIISAAGLDPRKAEKAAMAKYSWRASAPGNKDEDFEIKLIRNAW